MKFIIDHDYHIHSRLSLCSNDERQTSKTILDYAENNQLKEICITDHFWSENATAKPSDWYKPQNYAHISKILPLPQNNKARFYFGCETEMDKYFNLGISDTDYEKFDFIIVPTTHLHMNGFTIDEADFSTERRAYLYIERLNKLMDKALPFEKIGIAHLTCPLMAPADWESHLAVLDKITDVEYSDVFKKIAEKGAGFELNFEPEKYTPDDLIRVLRPYRIAKGAGCKFYFGSDAHHPAKLESFMRRAKEIIELLELHEEDKFTPLHFGI